MKRLLLHLTLCIVFLASCSKKLSVSDKNLEQLNLILVRDIDSGDVRTTIYPDGKKVVKKIKSKQNSTEGNTATNSVPHYTTEYYEFDNPTYPTHLIKHVVDYWQDSNSDTVYNIVDAFLVIANPWVTKSNGDRRFVMVQDHIWGLVSPLPAPTFRLFRYFHIEATLYGPLPASTYQGMNVFEFFKYTDHYGNP